MKILILGFAPFPRGLAGTNRILSYACGLARLGHEVHYFCLVPFESSFSSQFANTARRGVHEGVAFDYIAGSIPGAGHRVLRRWLFPFICVKMLFRIGGLLSSASRPDAVIAVLNPFSILLPIGVLCRFFNVKFILEKNEFPSCVIHPEQGWSRYNQFYLQHAFRLFDGIIVITRTLEQYLRPLSRHNCQFLLMPITVDSGRFANVGASGGTAAYIAYCGSMEGNKDGVEDLLRAFAAISADFSTLKLKLIGSCSDRKMDLLRSLVSELKLTEYVEFEGLVSRDLMPEILSNAKILALARPHSVQAQGGFPTKLGEYLLTGKPVVVTRVGEIPDYLKHGETAYLAEPDNPKDFAEKLRYVLNHYDEAMLVGVRGRQLAKEFFDADLQSQRLSSFLKAIAERIQET